VVFLRKLLRDYFWQNGISQKNFCVIDQLSAVTSGYK